MYHICFVYIYIYIYIKESVLFLVAFMYIDKGIDSITVVVVGIGLGYQSSNPEEAYCFSHRANTLGIGINPTILLLAMGK